MFSYNQISTVHNDIRKCRMITVLELRYNRLMAVPPCICQLLLERLELDSNDIQEIPAYMSSLHTLVHFSISNNHIRVVEEPSCRGLTRLKRLRMQQNELLVLPESFGCMTALEELNLSFNHLASLPQSISQLTGTSLDRLSIPLKITSAPSPATRMNHPCLYRLGSPLDPSLASHCAPRSRWRTQPLGTLANALSHRSHPTSPDLIVAGMLELSPRL